MARNAAGVIPAWVRADSGHDPLSRERPSRWKMRGYISIRAARKYVHLMDGGIVDNLAMRGMIDDNSGR